MTGKFKDNLNKFFKSINLKPVTVAAKCRLQFGGAVILVIFLALLIPNYWMDKLTENAGLDIGRTVLYLVKDDKFEFDPAAGKGVLRLRRSGTMDINDVPVLWFELKKDDPDSLKKMPGEISKRAEKLLENEGSSDIYWIGKNQAGLSVSNYITVVRAKDVSSDSGYLESLTPGYSANEPVGILYVQTPALQISRTKLFNNIAIIVAGLVAATGALIAFYLIAQRIILRPIRQLRALVNNISEGNLDARSSINTQDEYQKLADAFNDMLDGLEKTQNKLRQSNRQLDDKIAELSDRNIELYKANKLQSEFLANISHEFRTPLNAILGFADILKVKSGDEKNVRYAENIITSGRNLLAMINDLLDLAKLEAGKMQVRNENTSIPDLCRSVAGFFGPLMSSKKLDIELEINNDVPIIFTDPMKVQQILFNFVSNAIKFSPENETITLKVHMPSEKTIRVEVADNGPGIGEGEKEKIFEKFRQGDSSITRETSGTGLGLAISKELSMLLAGDIGVISEKGSGAIFWLDIPVRFKPEADGKPAG